ncbi:MAG: 4-alpha-glucanotransferase [Thermoproteota archaeon]
MHLRKRSSGIHLHIASLPSNFGIGDLGPKSFEFIELLYETKQNFWEILPVTPTREELGNSPYLGGSSFAGNTLLISPDLLEEEDLLNLSDSHPTQGPQIDYDLAREVKHKMMKQAFKKFQENFQDYKYEFDTFCSENKRWLGNYTLYKTLRENIGKPWYLWPPPLRDREGEALATRRRRFKESIDFHRFEQFIFYRQWSKLKKFCNDRGVKIIGDLPFYVNHDSADAWVHPEMFKLDEEKQPLFLSGVPPDYFSDTGQLWGTPVYDWERLRDTGFQWWIDRIRHQLEMFDALRLDHFRGFSAYWQVPGEAETAEEGSWEEVPTHDFFKALARYLPTLPFVAEDLGVITADVRETRNSLEIPGMKVLLFAFDGSPDNPYLPHNHTRNSVVLTGTHDTNTVKGWFLESSSETRQFLNDYLGRKPSEKEISWELIRLAMSSVSNLSLIPLQDVLSLGSEARMNYPDKSGNNWRWKVTDDQLEGDPFIRLKEMTETFGRD